jgi:hypothetical protein
MRVDRELSRLLRLRRKKRSIILILGRKRLLQIRDIMLK